MGYVTAGDTPGNGISTGHAVRELTFLGSLYRVPSNFAKFP